MASYAEPLSPDAADRARRVLVSLLKDAIAEGSDPRRLGFYLKAGEHFKPPSPKRLLARLHAYKFSAMAHSPTSAIRLGRDVAHDFICLGDAEGARQFFEQSLLQVVTGQGLLDHLIPVRAQYAVVLAYLGRVAEAVNELAALQKFGLSPELKQEVNHQLDLVERIADGRARIPPRPPAGHANIGAPSRRNVGRNQPCPCGSGRKYKVCCLKRG